MKNISELENETTYSIPLVFPTVAARRRQSQLHARDGAAMNESIIRELAFKAGAKLYMEPPSQEVTGVSMSVESVRRFAELIVRECLDQLLVSDPKEDFDKGIIWSREQIKDHFGVK